MNKHIRKQQNFKTAIMPNLADFRQNFGIKFANQPNIPQLRDIDIFWTKMMKKL